MRSLHKKPTYDMETIKEVRERFWQEHSEFERVKGQRQNDYNATIRSVFVRWVDSKCRSNEISTKLAERVTL